MKAKWNFESNEECLKLCLESLKQEVDFAIVNEYGERKAFRVDDNNCNSVYVRKYIRFCDDVGEEVNISFDIDDIYYR